MGDIEVVVDGFYERLLALFKIEVAKDGYCKSFEPSIKFSFEHTNDSDMRWSCVIYSYVVCLVDDEKVGGRHYCYVADSFDELVCKVEKAISSAEEEVLSNG